MTTDFTKAINASGAIKPTTVNTPLDVRTRIESISEVENIPLPFIGMIFYVIDEDKYYSVKTLKGQTIAGTTKPNMLIDTYSELTTGSSSGSTSADVPVATTSTAGKVKPDGTTITVTSDGTISATATTPDLSDYQTKTDSSLTTTAKTIVGAINEVKQTASAGIDSAAITNAVNSYLSEHPVSSESKYKDKTILFIGDSLTFGNNGAETNDRSISYHVGKHFKESNIINNGHNGAGSEDFYNTLKTKTSFLDVIAIVANYGTNDGGANGTISTSIPEMVNLTLRDVVTNGVTIGTTSITTEEEYWSLFSNNWVGNMAKAIEYIKFYNPMTQIYLHAPHYIDQWHDNLASGISSAMKNLAEYYGIVYLPAGEEIGITKRNAKYYKTNNYTDWAHLNDIGNQIKGNYIAHSIESKLLYPSVDYSSDTNLDLSSITLSKSSINVEVDGVYYLYVFTKPFNASSTNRELTVSTNNSNVTVEKLIDGIEVQKYKVTGVAEGECTITFTHGNLSSECVATVGALPDVAVTGISFTVDSIDLETSKSYTVSYTITPSDATNKNVTFSVNNSYCSISESGVITAGNSVGTSIITVTTEDGSFTDTLTVNVVEQLTYPIINNYTVGTSSEITLGKIANESTGAIEDNSSYAIIEINNVKQNTEYICYVDTSKAITYLRVVYYDSNSDFISKEDINSDYNFTTPPNTSKFIISESNVSGTDYLKGFTIVERGDYMDNVITGSDYGVTVEMARGGINSKGEITYDNKSITLGYVVIDPSSTYTISNGVFGGTSAYGTMIAYFYDSSKNYISSVNLDGTARTFTSVENSEYCRIVSTTMKIQSIKVTKTS